MQQIELQKNLVKKLFKESGNSNEVFRCLCRESAARKWLKINGISSWRNPETPSEEACSSRSVRPGYSVLLADGSRFLVCSNSAPSLSMETLAAAKCFAALTVKLENSGTSWSGSVTGCVFLRDMEPGETPFLINGNRLRPAEDLLHYTVKHGTGTHKPFIFNAGLLLFGEPDAPEYGTDGAHHFSPDAQNRKRAVL